MADLVAQVSGAFAAELSARASWGEPPCVYTIRVRSGLCELAPVAVPPSWWAGGPLPEVLAMVAQTAADIMGVPGIRPRPDSYGAAVRFEGLAVHGESLDAEQFRNPDDDAMARTAGLGRDLVPVRVLVGADRAGVAYFARQLRGQREVRSAITLPAGDLGRSSVITAAVRELTAAVTGVPQPRPAPRAEPER